MADGSTRLLSARLGRANAVILFLAVLGTLFVGMGATEPDPALNDYPGADEVVVDYEGHVGERAVITGTVTSTDPVVIVVGPSRFEFVVTDLEREVREGTRLSVFGTVEPEFTIAAERSLVHESWTLTYMYAVSLVAAALVAGRFLRHWRIDLGRPAFAPRGEDDA